MTSISKRSRYEQTRSQLWNVRSAFEATWRDLADYIISTRTQFGQADKNKGSRRNQKIIDSTATFAARTLRSGMHAGITSPARPWMRLTTPDPGLAEFGPVKEWLHTVTQRMRTVFLRSNLYNVLPTTYGDMGVFATAAMAVMEDSRDLMRCYSYPTGSFALGINARGMVDTFIREYSLTVLQLVDQFGLENLSRTARQLWDRSEYQQNVDVCWILAPNVDRSDARYEARFMPYASCYFEKGQDSEGKFLRESGFNEFPILAPRWDVTGEDIYGTDCPGITALGDIKALQVMQKRKAQAVEKMLNPPTQAPSQLQNKGGVSLIAGDTNYVDLREGQQGIKPVHEIKMSVSEITADIQDTRQLIRRSFYEDLFLMLAQTDRREITAREIDERHEEKLLALGPVLERTNDELLDPLVDRTYAMMDRAGLIPPPPPDLEGVNLKVEYISLMAQAQKLVGAVGADRFFASVMAISEQFPEARYKVNPMQAVDDYGDVYGVNPKLIVPDEEAEAALQATQQAAQQQRQIELAAMGARGAKDLAQAPVNEDNALTRALESVGA
jgi:hypothetical protein